MKILHVINYYHEGFGYQENCLPKVQQELGHEVLVITSENNSPYLQTIHNKFMDRYVGVGVFFDNNVKIIRRKSYLKSIKRPGIIFFRVGKILSEYRPDIVHVHGATNMVIPEVCLRQSKFKYKIFIDSHQDDAVCNYTGSFDERAYYSAWRFFYHSLGFKKHIARFLLITGNALEWMRKRLNIPESRMSISPLGVDVNTMSYDKDIEKKFREKHGIGEKLVVVNAGKQYPNKRIDWIIDAASAAKDLGVDIYLILVGNAEPEYDAYINRKLNGLGPDYLRLPLLERSELRKVYSAADIGIWPGIPSNTIQEAMVCRVVLVLPDDNIVGHLIDGNGLLESNDANAAGKYIQSLARNKDLMERQKARSEEIGYSYSWERIAGALDHIYKND